MLSEPIEPLIVRAQQNSDVAGGLNPIQVQITDDTALNLLKKYKNVAYKVNVSWFAISSQPKKQHRSDICNS